jgi:hypothetical protein
MPHYDPVQLGVDRYGKHSASKNAARLTRAQFQDYMKRFAPTEDELIGEIGNPAYYGEQVRNALAGVRAGFAGQAGQTGRELSRYGVSASPEQQQTLARQRSRAQAASEAGAANRTRRGLKRRDLDIMGGGIIPQQPQPKTVY